MSQYPSPYQPPGQQYPMSFDYYQPADALAPARAAAVMLFVLGGAMVLGAFCCAGTGAMVPQMMAQNPEAFADLNRQFPQITPDMMRLILLAAAAVVFVVSVAMIVLGVFVRRGSKVAVVIAIVLAILALLYFVLSTVVSLVTGATGGGSPAAAVCMTGVLVGVCAVLLWMLFRALPACDRARAMQDQYNQQYWQYAYQQQMYGQQQPPGAPAQPPVPPPPQQTWRPQEPWPPPPPPPPQQSPPPPPEDPDRPSA